VGNCGSPLETPEGWLVLTHGVGPMRTYALGAILLDLDDPCRVLATLPARSWWPTKTNARDPRAGVDVPLLSPLWTSRSVKGPTACTWWPLPLSLPTTSTLHGTMSGPSSGLASPASTGATRASHPGEPCSPSWP
jgi:hypothetical protein